MNSIRYTIYVNIMCVEINNKLISIHYNFEDVYLLGLRHVVR
jgi:hypothetical protein